MFKQVAMLTYTSYCSRTDIYTLNVCVHLGYENQFQASLMACVCVFWSPCTSRMRTYIQLACSMRVRIFYHIVCALRAPKDTLVPRVARVHCAHNHAHNMPYAQTHAENTTDARWWCWPQKSQRNRITYFPHCAHTHAAYDGASTLMHTWCAIVLNPYICVCVCANHQHRMLRCVCACCWFADRTRSVKNI